MHDMGWLLNNFANSVAGIAHVVAVSADGLLLASSRDLPTDRADQLAAIASGVVSLTEGAARMFNAGAVQQTIIEMDSGYLFLMSVSDGSSMAVLAARSCDVGQAGHELALLVERVGAGRATAPPETLRVTRPVGGGYPGWRNRRTGEATWFARTRFPGAGPSLAVTS